MFSSSNRFPLTTPAAVCDFQHLTSGRQVPSSSGSGREIWPDLADRIISTDGDGTRRPLHLRGTAMSHVRRGYTQGQRYAVNELAPVLAPVASHYGAEPGQLESVAGIKRMLQAIVDDVELLRSEADRYAAIENICRTPDAELCASGQL